MDPMHVLLNPHFGYHEGACVLRRRGSSKAGGGLFRDDWLLLLSSTWTIFLTFKNLKVAAAAAAAAIPQILLQNSTKTIIRCVYKTASYVASRTAWSRACNVVGLRSRGSGQMFCICCKIWDCQQYQKMDPDESWSVSACSSDGSWSSCLQDHGFASKPWNPKTQLESNALFAAKLYSSVLDAIPCRHCPGGLRFDLQIEWVKWAMIMEEGLQFRFNFAVQQQEAQLSRVTQVRLPFPSSRQVCFLKVSQHGVM